MKIIHSRVSRDAWQHSMTLLSLSAFVCCSAQAADFIVEPRVEVGALYNDNYRTVPDGEDEVQGGLADVAVNFRSVTPTSEFHVQPRLRSTYFPDDRDEDYNNGYLDLGYAYQGLRSQFDFDARYSREDLLSSELPDADTPDGDLGSAPGVGSGIVRVQNRRDLIRLVPSARFNLSERQTLNALVEYLDADYAEDEIGSNTDFSSVSGVLGLGFAITPTSELRIAAVGTQFSPDTQLTGDSTSYGVRGEYWANRTEIWQTYVRLGAERTSQDDPEIGEAPDDTTNVIFGAGVSAKYQVTTLFADLSRAVRPNASGELVNRDELRFRVVRNFTPKVSGIAALRGVQDTGAQDDDGFVDRRYLVGSFGVEWRVTPEWALRADYDYRRQKYDNVDGEGSSNQLLVSIVYEPRRDLR